MKEIRYTETQKEIIKNRETLATLHYLALNGFAFDDENSSAKYEKLMNELFTLNIERIAHLRKRQQEAFDRMPWLANMCGRV